MNTNSLFNSINKYFNCPSHRNYLLLHTENQRRVHNSNRCVKTSVFNTRQVVSDSLYWLSRSPETLRPVHHLPPDHHSKESLSWADAAEVAHSLLHLPQSWAPLLLGPRLGCKPAEGLWLPWNQWCQTCPDWRYYMKEKRVTSNARYYIPHRRNNLYPVTTMTEFSPKARLINFKIDLN